MKKDMQPIPLIAILDVDYRENDSAVAAAIVIEDWMASEPKQEQALFVLKVAPYKSGEFYKRELLPLLKLLEMLPTLQTIVIDGYVWLDGQGRPGLGAHLYEATEKKYVVIGIAKTKFSNFGVEILRGKSKRPLFITSAGIDSEEAAKLVQGMPGERIPTMVKRADSVARSKFRTD